MPHDAARDLVRRVLDALRREVLDGSAPADRAVLTFRAEARLADEAVRARTPRLRRVINATGVVLHTNLGRAPLGAAVLDRVREVSRGYATLEYDLDAGRRGHRDRLVAAPIAALLGAQDALVVNNNAAAVLLAATALAAGRDVIVSRGELVEIGGGFRVPEILATCGARLVEVGTTNRTRVEDYARAITASTALILRVHHSNFSIVGFTARPSLAALCALGEASGIPVIEDLGSGAIVNTAAFGLAHEPTARESLAVGVALVMTSGDKLLGGPQAGILAGRQSLVDTLRMHPLSRALRPGRLVLAALEATLRVYAEGREREDIPVVTMLAATDEVLHARAVALAAAIRATIAPDDLELVVVPSEGRVGGGSMPTATLPSWAVKLRLATAGQLAALERGLRRLAEPPVIARIVDDALVLDVRTLFDEDLEPVARGLACALAGLHEQILQPARFEDDAATAEGHERNQGAADGEGDSL